MKIKIALFLFSFIYLFDLLAQPANDNCSGATSISCGSTLTGQTTVGSSDNSSQIGCGIGVGVWYSFTATSNQSVTVTATPAAGFDIELGVGSGSCGSITNMTCVDAGFSGGAESYTFSAVSGTTYYFYVGYWLSGGTTTGSFDISLSCGGGGGSGGGGPANDDCANATAMNCGDNLTAQTTVGATANGSSTGCSLGMGVWYSFTPTTTQSVTVTASPAAGYDIELAVASGTCSSMTNVACEDAGISGDPETVTFTASAGVTYYFYVAHYSSTSTTTGTFDISLSCSAPTPCPVNSNITGLPFTATGQTTCGAGDDFSSSDACGSSYMNGDDYVYTYTPSANECISITLSNTNSWTGVFVTDGCPSDPSTNCTASNTNSSGNPSISSAALIAGTTYYITISTFPSPQCTPFDISITSVSPCNPCGSNGTNDFCEDAATLTPGGSFLSNTTSAYTVDAPGNLNSEFCGSIDNNSWYQFTATSTTETFNFNTVANCTYSDGIQAEVYSVTTDANGCCSNFTSMSNCWNPATQTSGTVTATGLTVGQTYYLMVDGYAGDQCDFEVLGWSSTPVLPVELISFTGKPIAEGNFLKWVTATEINNKAFFVERSVDGHLFETIGRVEGNGNSNVINNYSYIDENVAPTSTFYYRLKQMDFDGKISYSDVIVINRNDAIIDVYPNPSDDNLYLNLQNIDEQNITIKIYDVVGKEIYSSTGNISSNSQTINLSNEINLSKGIYFIAVYNNQNEKIFFEQIIRK